MTSTLLIENIKVGELDFDDMSGIPTPYLKTYIEDVGYNIIMENFNFDFIKDTIEVTYLYTEYDEDWCDEQTVYKFSTEAMEYDSNNNPKDFYRLNEIKESV